MEGVTGVTNWEEVDHNKSAYIQFQKQISLEVAAACEGAIAAGAKRTAKAAADNAGKLITAGLVVGGGLYLENKFKEADEDIKNCINVCLPENWTKKRSCSPHKLLPHYFFFTCNQKWFFSKHDRADCLILQKNFSLLIIYFFNCFQILFFIW